MKVGDIIRRVLHSGKTVGNYIIVTDKRNGMFYGKYLSSEEEFPITASDTTMFKPLKIVALKIPRNDWDRVAKGWTFSYYHGVNKEWEKAADGSYDIVKIYDTTGRKAYFIGCEFARIAKRTKGKLVPYIKVYLNARIFIEE